MNTLALALVLFAMPSTQGEAKPCPELRRLQNDLRNIESTGRTLYRYTVTGARVKQMERRLAQFLQLPETVRLCLTTISGHRKNVTTSKGVFFRIEQRTPSRRLGRWMLSWSGNCFATFAHRRSMRFCRSTAKTGIACREHPNREHHPAGSIPRYFRGLGEISKAIDHPRFAGASVDPTMGVKMRPDGHVEFRVFLRHKVGSGTTDIWAHVQMPITAEAAKRPPASIGSRVLAARLADRLDACIELRSKIDLDLQQPVDLRVDKQEPSRLRMKLRLYEAKVAGRWVDVSLVKTSRHHWVLFDASGLIPRGCARIEDFIALLHLAKKASEARNHLISAFGLAWDPDRKELRACVTSLPAGPMWPKGTMWWADEATLLTLRAVDGKARIVTEQRLLGLRRSPQEPRGPNFIRVGRTAKGLECRIPIRIDSCGGRLLGPTLWLSEQKYLSVWRHGQG